MVVAVFANALPLHAETVLGTFSCQEQLGRDWPRTMLRYTVKFPKGRVRSNRVRLLDQEGEEVPVQMSRVERHSDGSVASALVCFLAELPKDGSYRYQLVEGQAAVKTPNPPQANSQGSHLTLDNGIVAIRLPKAGTVSFNEPLHFGTGHEEMIKLYGRQETAGIAPGPIQGFRIRGNRWVGGSYFEAAKPDDAPQVLG